MGKFNTKKQDKDFIMGDSSEFIQDLDNEVDEINAKIKKIKERLDKLENA